MVSHGMVCLGPQWSGNICKVLRPHGITKSGHSALKITHVLFCFFAPGMGRRGKMRGLRQREGLQLMFSDTVDHKGKKYHQS